MSTWNSYSLSTAAPGTDALRLSREKRPLTRLAAAVALLLVLCSCIVAVARSDRPAGANGADRSAARAPRPFHSASPAHSRLTSRLTSASHRNAATADAQRSGLPPLSPTAGLPADCVPKPQGPPGAPYELGLVGTVHKGVLTAGPATVADITAKFCGVVTVVNGKPPCGATGSVVSPEDGQVFGSLSATLSLIPKMSPKVPFVAHPGIITGGFRCASSHNGLAVTLNATVTGSTGLYGLSCTIGPLTIPLSGVLTGPLSHASIILRSNDFAVPAVSVSPACPGQVPANLDAIAGLPIRPGGASVTLPATATLYQPAN